MQIEYKLKLNFFSLFAFSWQKMHSELNRQKVNVWVRYILANPLTLLGICIYSSIQKRSFIFKPFCIVISEEMAKAEVINEQEIFLWEEFIGVDNLRKYLILEFHNGEVIIPKSKITEIQNIQLLSFIESL